MGYTLYLCGTDSKIIEDIDFEMPPSEDNWILAECYGDVCLSGMLTELYHAKGGLGEPEDKTMQLSHRDMQYLKRALCVSPWLPIVSLWLGNYLCEQCQDYMAFFDEASAGFRQFRTIYCKFS